MSRDLLRPEGLQEQYVHQVRQTIEAYNPTQIVVGEAMQNAIDAVVEADGDEHSIRVRIDLDERLVTVSDDGIGFPNDPRLLFLGGTRKRGAQRNLFGLIGVGIKVVLFKSETFLLRARNASGEALKYKVDGAFRFDADPPPDLALPDVFEADPDPLCNQGTEVRYSFAEGTARDPFEQFFREIQDLCLPSGHDKEFGKTLRRATEEGTHSNRFGVLLEAYLRRFTYAGDVANRLGNKPGLADTTIEVCLQCSDPTSQLGEELGELFDGEKEARARFEPTYLLVEDTRSWVADPRPGLFSDPLGRGGENLERTMQGFNTTIYADSEDFEKLLTRSDGSVGGPLEEYRRKLFPVVNGIVLTIGRIPLLNEFLPGGSRRVISANGVATTHDLDLTKGRNQEYVRCLDLTIDVDAPLNYGKAQLTNNHLVSLIRRFVNDAYLHTMQKAAGNWVGRIDVSPPEYDSFLSREDLGLTDYVSYKAPRDENDVIALFFELAARGHLSGYRFLGLSQVDQYDARALIQRQRDSRIREMPPDDRQLDVVEFKVRAADLIRDLERGAKAAREMHLLIAWEEGERDSNRYAFANIEHSRGHPDEVFHGVQRYLDDARTGAQIQVLLLKPIVEQILADGED